jgi:uncharacterized coiled-coil protein SlyX
MEMKTDGKPYQRTRSYHVRCEVRGGPYSRGINVNHTPEYDTSVTKQDKINSLFEYLIDAKNDMDRVQDSLKDLTNKLDTLLDMVEYEAIAKRIR